MKEDSISQREHLLVKFRTSWGELRRRDKEECEEMFVDASGLDVAAVEEEDF